MLSHIIHLSSEEIKVKKFLKICKDVFEYKLKCKFSRANLTKLNDEKKTFYTFTRIDRMLTVSNHLKNEIDNILPSQ